MNLFQTGQFKLHSGEESDFKIECDALTEEDWETIARQLYYLLPKWPGEVVGVATGGDRLADHMSRWIVPGSELTVVCDDVWTTGKSMRLIMSQQAPPVIGVVAFARGLVDTEDVIPLFNMSRQLAPSEWQLREEVRQLSARGSK